MNSENNERQKEIIRSRQQQAVAALKKIVPNLRDWPPPAFMAMGTYKDTEGREAQFTLSVPFRQPDQLVLKLDKGDPAALAALRVFLAQNGVTIGEQGEEQATPYVRMETPAVTERSDQQLRAALEFLRAPQLEKMKKTKDAMLQAVEILRSTDKIEELTFRNMVAVINLLTDTEAVRRLNEELTSVIEAQSQDPERKLNLLLMSWNYVDVLKNRQPKMPVDNKTLTDYLLQRLSSRSIAELQDLIATDSSTRLLLFGIEKKLEAGWNDRTLDPQMMEQLQKVYGPGAPRRRTAFGNRLVLFGAQSATIENQEISAEKKENISDQKLIDYFLQNLNEAEIEELEKKLAEDKILRQRLENMANTLGEKMMANTLAPETRRRLITLYVRQERSMTKIKYVGQLRTMINYAVTYGSENAN